MMKREFITNILLTVLLGFIFPTGLIGQSIGIVPSKQERKEARKMEKEGWKPMPASLKIEEQLHQTHQMQQEQLTIGLPKYYMAVATAKASTINQARMMASEFAQQEIIVRVKAEVKSLTDYYMSTLQHSSIETETHSRVVFETMVSATQKLRSSTPVMELYRPTENGMVEVMIRLASSVEDIINDKDSLTK